MNKQEALRDEGIHDKSGLRSDDPGHGCGNDDRLLHIKGFKDTERK